MKVLTLAVLLILICSGCHRGTEQATVTTVVTNDAVTVSDVRIHSAAVGGVLRYEVIIPVRPDNRRLPVLYLLHGANSDPEEIMEHSEIANLARAEQIAVVLPYGKFSYYTNAKHKRNARWEAAITRDLMSDVEARFPVLADREHRGIAGISMGGYGAAKLSLKHPDLYTFTGVMSGALDITRRPASLRRWGQTWRIWTIFGFRPTTRSHEDVFLLLRNGNPTPPSNWFISCGASDPLLDVNERFARQIRQPIAVTPGWHDWTSWNNAMPQMMRTAGKALR